MQVLKPQPRALRHAAPRAPAAGLSASELKTRSGAACGGIQPRVFTPAATRTRDSTGLRALKSSAEAMA